jgi:hypothetical protein
MPVRGGTSVRRAVVRIAVVVASVSAAIWLTAHHVAAPTDDFAAYWASARLLASGENPYDFDTLLSVQRSVGWPHATPLPTWYGPWILTAAVPVGLMPYWPARIIWLCGQIASLLGSAMILGRVYGYDAASRVPVLVTLSSAGAILCLIEGQITPFALLGLAGFVLLTRLRKDWLAGAALFPVTAKPLTLYLFFLALALWLQRSRRFGVIGGVLITVGAMSTVAIVLRSTVFNEWIRFSSYVSPLEQGYTPTVGTILRALFGADRLWLSYLSPIVGAIWFVTLWQRYGTDLDWRHELPMLSIVSLLTTPFAWSHDALLLMPAFLQMAATYSGTCNRYAWIAANVLAVALYPWLRYKQAVYILYPAFVLAIRHRRSWRRPIED